MTNNDQKELANAIRLARATHERGKDPADGTVVILGALIRAVELMAWQTPSVVSAANERPATLREDMVRAFKNLDVGMQQNATISDLFLFADIIDARTEVTCHCQLEAGDSGNVLGPAFLS